MSKLAVVSLGCAKNLVDTEILLGQLLGESCTLTDNFQEADYILVNTCGFIESAKEESIQQIFEMAAYKNPKVGSCQKLIVAGCLVQRYAAELSKSIPEVDHWLGLADLGKASETLRGGSKISGLDGQPFLNDENLPRYQVTLNHTAYVKIAEGCNHSCAYCAIPLIKGRFRSRNPEAVVKEIARLVAGGVKEINLIAQDITMYGLDLQPQLNLVGLLREIVARAQPAWIRLLYAYPSGIGKDLLELMASEKSICHYLDLPLQHINARILKLMHRPDPPAVIKQKIALIKETVPEMALRTTFLTGFPTETAAEFQELLTFVRESHFQHLGVFAYSREEGTAAYSLKPQISKTVKEARRRRLMEAQQENSRLFLASQLGKTVEVLVDKVMGDGNAVGRARHQAPDVDGAFYLKGFRGVPGTLISAQVTGHDEYNLVGEPLNQS